MNAIPGMEVVALALLASAACAALAYALIALRRVRELGAENDDAELAPPRMFSLSVPVDALLPAELPVVDGLRLSASYVAGADAAGGGDFYDAFFLDDDSVALVIGSATGSGIGAVTTMNVARQALRNALIDGAPPVDALRRANRVLLRSGPPAIVSAAVGIVEPATLQLRYASAGHVPPMLATNDGEVTTLPRPASDIPLGAVHHHVTTELRATLPVDALLAFYTEGCVPPERDEAGASLAIGEALIAARTLRPTKPAVAIDRAIFGGRARSADAAILTVAPEPTLAHVDVHLPAEPASAPLARAALRRFFAATPLDERRTYDALVAAGEAVSNAIEHAYDGRPHRGLHLSARHEDRSCVVIVEDRGTWRQDEGEPRGRGVAMMRRLSDACSIERGPNGTSVMLRFALTARLSDAALVGAAHQ